MAALSGVVVGSAAELRAALAQGVEAARAEAAQRVSGLGARLDGRLDGVATSLQQRVDGEVADLSMMVAAKSAEAAAALDSGLASLQRWAAAEFSRVRVGVSSEAVRLADLVTAAQAGSQARPSLIPSLCTHFTRAGIEWRR